MDRKQYEAFCYVKEEAAKMASFLRKTAKRHAEIRQGEIISRMNDVADILDESNKIATQKWFGEVP